MLAQINAAVMPANNLAMNVVKPCVRVGGPAVVSCLPRKLPPDNRQHLSSDFLKPQLNGSQQPSSLSFLATQKALSGLRKHEHEGLNGVAFAPLPHGIDIPTIESTRTSRTLRLLGFEHLDSLGDAQVLLKQDACEVDVIEDPPTEAKTFSGSLQTAPSQKTEKRRRAKANAKVAQLSMAHRLDHAQKQLKKYQTIAAATEMRHQKQLVIRAWASMSARTRRDAAKQRQLSSQRRTYAVRAIQANLDRRQQLVLRSWSAIAADSQKTRVHQQELDALRSSNVATEQYSPIQFGSVDSDCPLPPGLWPMEDSGITDAKTNSPAQSTSCSACLGDWGCLEHAVYSSRLFLAQRELEMKMGRWSRGPPGLTLDKEATQVAFTHLRLAPVDNQAKVEIVRQTKTKQRRQRHA